jgi:hypothetical protein
VKLEGTIDMFPLRELIDMVVYSSVTGVLNIYGSGDVGHLYFRESTLYHIERGSSSGVEALAELLELSHGSFSFVSEAIAHAETLYGSLSTNLLAAERLGSRWRQIRAYVPTLDLVPHLVVAREAALRRVGPGHHDLLLAIDGRASLRQIAVYLAWPTIDIAEAAAQMTVDGVVDLRNGNPQIARPASSQEPAAESEGGIFDRILSRGGAPEGVEAPTRPLDPSSYAGQEDLILRMLRGSS